MGCFRLNGVQCCLSGACRSTDYTARRGVKIHTIHLQTVSDIGKVQGPVITPIQNLSLRPELSMYEIRLIAHERC